MERNEISIIIKQIKKIIFCFLHSFTIMIFKKVEKDFINFISTLNRFRSKFKNIKAMNNKIIKELRLDQS
jgi:hypothetical protein